jgi:hypothetical protein
MAQCEGEGRYRALRSRCTLARWRWRPGAVCCVLSAWGWPGRLCPLPAARASVGGAWAAGCRRSVVCDMRCRARALARSVNCIHLAIAL